MNNLRPTKLEDIIGQSKVKQQVSILIKSAKTRNDILDHCLLSGPAGTGKSSFATIIANELDSKILTVNGGSISKVKDLLPILIRLKKGDVFFIDEIHNLNINLAENMYSVMEDFVFNIGKGAAKIDLPKFTIIGATTHQGLLSKPLYDRFKNKLDMELYNVNDLSSIIQNNTHKLNIQLSDNIIQKIAKISRGTPRIANNYLLWIRDYIVAHKIKSTSLEQFKAAMELIGVDEDGMTKDDRRYIAYLKSKSKPVGLRTIASALGLAVETVENTIESWLLQQGMIEKTQKGRVYHENS
jgi:Holliday junction DNA helicase RuvB